MSDSELRSRLVFVDTSVYEKKNFQFGDHVLHRFKEIIDSGKILLLITDVTINEIKSHLLKESKDASAKLKKIQKEAKILRNTPELPCHNIFNKVNAEVIHKSLESKFKAFIVGNNIEIVNVDTVNPSSIFDLYFSEKAPFDGSGKKSEFPDAFALEAINKISRSRANDVYVISTDGDMARYCEERVNLIYLDSIDKLIDLVVRNDEELKAPAQFADTIFNSLDADIAERIKNQISEFEIFDEDYNAFDYEIADIKIESVEIVSKKLIEVTNESAEYEIDFNVVISAQYSVNDYDSSPWDSEDKAFLFIVTYDFIKKHEDIYSAYVTISYAEGLKSNAEIIGINFDDNCFNISNSNSEITDKCS